MNSKLIDLLMSFTKLELKEFVRFVNSPYFNNDLPVQKFTALLAKAYPGFSEKKLLKQKVFLKLYPGKKFNDALLRNVTSKTLKLAERYLVISKFENSESNYLLLKLRVLGDKNLPFFFEKARLKGEKYLEDIPYRESSFYYTKMMFEDEIRRFALRINSKVYLPDDNYQCVVDNCINFFSAELMRCYAVMINANKYLKETPFDMRFLSTLLAFFEENPEYFEGMHYVHLYYNSIRLFQTEEEKYFDKVYHIVHGHFDKLPDIDKKNSYVVLANHCSEMINKGQVNYMRKKFLIYKEIIARDAQYEGLDYISHVFYNRVVYTAVNLGELKWASWFMEKFKPELPVEHRDNTYFLSISEYYLKLGKFDEALKALSLVQKLDRMYKQQIYALLLKIYFSSGETEFFYSSVSSFRAFLSTSNVISERNRRLDSNFVKIIISLKKVKDSEGLNRGKDIHDLREEIIKNEYTSEKFWLLEKLKEISG